MWSTVAILLALVGRAAAGGMMMHLQGKTPKIQFGRESAGVTLIHNVSEPDKLTCSAEFEARDVRVAGLESGGAGRGAQGAATGAGTDRPVDVRPATHIRRVGLHWRPHRR
jgi:hypothetical protein